MSANPVRDAWPVAERACFELLKRALGSVENLEAFLGKLPRRANRTGGLRQFAFRFTGGGEAMVPRPESARSVTSWQHEAIFEARFLGNSNYPQNDERSIALQVIGILRETLPAGRQYPDTSYPMPTVATLYLTTHPACEPDTVEVSTDGDVSTAGEVEIWRVTAPMTVVYDKAEGE